MKAIWNIAAATLAASFPGLAMATDAGLTDHRWRHRPILVFAEAGDPRLAQQVQRFETAQTALDDRDNVVIVDTQPGSALRARFRPDGFTVILVGLDGGEKFRATEVIDPGTLNALIDTMPMRQRELSGQD